jgi:hypothetical protein
VESKGKRFHISRRWVKGIPLSNVPCVIRNESHCPIHLLFQLLATLLLLGRSIVVTRDGESHPDLGKDRAHVQGSEFRKGSLHTEQGHNGFVFVVDAHHEIPPSRFFVIAVDLDQHRLVTHQRLSNLVGPLLENASLLARFN